MINRRAEKRENVILLRDFSLKELFIDVVIGFILVCTVEHYKPHIYIHSTNAYNNLVPAEYAVTIDMKYIRHLTEEHEAQEREELAKESK